MKENVGIRFAERECDQRKRDNNDNGNGNGKIGNAAPEVELQFERIEARMIQHPLLGQVEASSACYPRRVPLVGLGVFTVSSTKPQLVLDANRL